MSLDLDSILDSSIDDLADLPEFQVFPNGVHKVIISWESKEVNKHPCMELKMKAVETVELANPAADSPLAAGTESSVLFMLDNEFGQGKFKSIIKQIAEATGSTKISEAVEASNGMEVQVVCKVRQNKDKSQSYTDVTKVIV
jgi:hypothetical protein